MTTNQIADLIIADLEYREPNQSNCEIDSDDRVYVAYDITSTFKVHAGTQLITPDETVESRSIYIHNAGFWVDEELMEWSESQRKEVEDFVNERIK